MKIRSPDKLILGHVNINSIRSKYYSLIYMLDKSVDISLLSETRLDESFLLTHFKIEGFTTPHRYHRNDKRGGLLFYIREDIPSGLLQCKSQCNIESLSVEINLKKRKRFLNCCHNPKRSSVSRHLECLNYVIDEHIKAYDNFILIGDFNVGIDENFRKNACDLNCLKTLIKNQHVSKTLTNPHVLTIYSQIGPIYSNTAVLLKQAFETSIF